MTYLIMTWGLVVLAVLGFWGDICEAAPLKGDQANTIPSLSDEYKKIAVGWHP